MEVRAAILLEAGIHAITISPQEPSPDPISEKFDITLCLSLGEEICVSLRECCGRLVWFSEPTTFTISGLSECHNASWTPVKLNVDFDSLIEFEDLCSELRPDAAGGARSPPKALLLQSAKQKPFLCSGCSRRFGQEKDAVNHWRDAHKPSRFAAGEGTDFQFAALKVRYEDDWLAIVVKPQVPQLWQHTLFESQFASSIRESRCRERPIRWATATR